MIRIRIDRERCMGSGSCQFHAPHVFELGILVAQPVDLVVDLVIGHIGSFDFDRTAAEIGHCIEQRPECHLDIYIDTAAVRLADVLDSRGCRRLELGLFDGGSHEVGQRFVDGFVA